jgi:thioredoxin-related protein
MTIQRVESPRTFWCIKFDKELAMRFGQLIAVIFIVATFAAIPVSVAEPVKPAKPKISDESAEGNKQIADALTLAKKEKKRVLLQFGANWCGWCHRLHKLFESDKEIAATLKANFIVVLVDVNEKHNSDVDEKYGHPTKHGLPVIVVLDADGKQLTTKNTEELEEGDHHDPAKVKAFLKEWAGK